VIDDGAARVLRSGGFRSFAACGRYPLISVEFRRGEMVASGPWDEQGNEVASWPW